MEPVLTAKIFRALFQKTSAFLGRLYPLQKTLDAMALRPFELHLELTNLCNAKCVFCPYQFQTRPIEFMSDRIFEKAVSDLVAIGGGSAGLTPIVGDALIDPHFVERVKHLRSMPSIDRIWVITNGILLDQHGIEKILNSGLTSITISTAGFDEEMYQRVYRSNSYQRMKNNVMELLKRNACRSEPLPVTLALRPDRPLHEVMRDPDFQPILARNPELDFTWSYTSAGGRITREALPEQMKLRVVTSRKEICVNLYNGPIVLPGGMVMACSCVAAMDAIADLEIGNIMESSLLEIWRSHRMQQLRAAFGTNSLNKTCAGCDMYRNLELYRTPEGRERASINRMRHKGQSAHRKQEPRAPFSGG